MSYTMVTLIAHLSCHLFHLDQVPLHLDHHLVQNQLRVLGSGHCAVWMAHYSAISREAELGQVAGVLM